MTDIKQTLKAVIGLYVKTTCYWRFPLLPRWETFSEAQR